MHNISWWDKTQFPILMCGLGIGISNNEMSPSYLNGFGDIFVRKGLFVKKL